MFTGFAAAARMSWLLVALVSAGSACRERSAPKPRERAISSAALARASSSSQSKPPRFKGPEPPLHAENVKPVPLGAASSPTGSAVAEEELGLSAVILDDLVDIGPAGPASAHGMGVVLIDKQQTLHVARRGSLSKTREPVPSPIAPLDLPRSAFAPYAKGPALAGNYAYWVNDKRLLRRRVDGTGQLEVLARDARSGTRVSATAAPDAPAVVAYVVAPDADGVPRAKLWVEGARTYELTPDGSGTSSVALARQKRAIIALSLDGRSGMTPLHARRIVQRGSELSQGPDVVVWIGASAQSTTEVIAATRGDDVWGLLAIERDVLRFGLAQVRVGTEPRMEVPAVFVPFENGLNTSPIAAASLCGKTLVVFARPSAAAPGAPQELVLAELREEGLRISQIFARASAFADASVTALEGGALLCYTADYRTWAATLRCRTDR